MAIVKKTAFRRRLALAAILGLLGPLPSAHLDGYWPAGAGLFFSVVAVSLKNPDYLVAMLGLVAVYITIGFGGLTAFAWLRRRDGRLSH